MRNFIYAFAFKLLSDFIFSNRKSIFNMKVLKGSGAIATRLVKRLISSILSFNLIKSSKSIFQAIKALYSIDALMIGVL
jgi:hypothetical protein